MGARLAASVEHHRSVGAGIALWVVVVVVALGAPGLYAYKKGLLFFARAAVPDSVTATLRDTLAQRLLGDTGASGAAPDTAVTRPAGEATHPPVAPGTPGRLTLQGLPAALASRSTGSRSVVRVTCPPAHTRSPCGPRGSRCTSGR